VFPIPGASVNEYGRGNNTPLHFAARNNHVEAVKFLMSVLAVTVCPARSVTRCTDAYGCVWLVGRGADATSQNWRGLEPAQVTENKEIGRIIYEHARRGGIPLVHEAPPPAPTKASDFTLGEGSELPDIIPSDPGVAVPGRAVRKAEPSTTPPLESSPRSLPQASPLVTIDLVEDKPPTVPAASEVTTEPAATDSQPTA
jgi:hypothetical protein